MKITAKIHWLISNKPLGIQPGIVEMLSFDVEPYFDSEDDIVNSIESELYEKYGVQFKAVSGEPTVEDDFNIDNLEDMIIDIEYDKICSKHEDYCEF